MNEYVSSMLKYVFNERFYSPKGAFKYLRRIFELRAYDSAYHIYFTETDDETILSLAQLRVLCSGLLTPEEIELALICDDAVWTKGGVAT